MNRIKKRVIVILIILACLAGVLLLMRGDEDTWICENGQWIKHGNPSAPMPSESCSGNMTVKIFLSDSRFAGEPYFDCSHTIAVERQIPKTLAAARAAIESLLRGATQEEINQGFVSNINSGVRIQKLSIENRTAEIDFDEQMEFQVGGSCRVAAIRAQITETLKQFPTVDSVVISINGRTEDILQP
ncbi:GerMN domain-containing protein [Patescibacteria group bacterium]|nr:GerMN domain-containing protein [Patescibacteria group bacterium]